METYSLNMLIKFYRTQILKDIESVKQEIIQKAAVHDTLKASVELSAEDYATLEYMENRLLGTAMDIVEHENTLRGLDVLEQVLYPQK